MSTGQTWRGMWRLGLILGLAWVWECGGEILAIGDQGYPHLYHLQPSIPVRWDEKTLALREAGAQAIRINSRGIRYIPSTYSSVVLGKGGKGGNAFQSTNAWGHVNCTRERNALCAIYNATTGTSVSTVFPDAPRSVFVGSTGNGDLDLLFGAKCPETKTNRMLSNGQRYDLSVCNVIGSGTDFVYLPYEEKLFVLAEPISFQMLVIISILTVGMTIVLAHNLEYTLGSMKKGSGSLVGTGGSIVLLCTTILATGNIDILVPYVTLEDRLGFVLLLGYVGYYTLRACINIYFHGYMEKHAVVNPILATLCVVAMRLYGSLDNPYTTLLTFLFSVRIVNRLLQKLSMYSAGVAKALDIAMDSILVSTLFYVGVIPQHNNDPSVIALYLLQGLFAAQTLARVAETFTTDRKD